MGNRLPPAATPAGGDPLARWMGSLVPAPVRTTIAITYGTYDLFHIGHVNLFRRIKERFGTLIVAVSTDDFNAIKGKRSAVRFEDRIEMVRACRYVDLAIAEAGWGQKERDIVEHGADAMVMGSDWTGRFDELKSLCEVVYLPRTDGVSSSELKQHIQTVLR
jgi:glycerol-3-phosphate cytidylyltransferase